MPIAIIDYGAGNLRSVQKALEKAGVSKMVSVKVVGINGGIQ